MITGIHHLTGITRDVQQNYNFYCNILGLRFVKQTINQDDINSYHLYYANQNADPGSALTFFGWDLQKGTIGGGEVKSITLCILKESKEYWINRLTQNSIKYKEIEGKLEFTDPDGLKIKLSLKNKKEWPDFTNTNIPFANQICGLNEVEITSSHPKSTQKIFELITGKTNQNTVTLDNGQKIKIETLTTPKIQGAGSMHHIAFNVNSEQEQLTLMKKLENNNIPTSGIIDRIYFKSLYFQEPGKNLFEIATKNPGYTVDESFENLGQTLKLPPHLEHIREKITNNLQPIKK